jgi:hypothetical protein
VICPWLQLETKTVNSGLISVFASGGTDSGLQVCRFQVAGLTIWS